MYLLQKLLNHSKIETSKDPIEVFGMVDNYFSRVSSIEVFGMVDNYFRRVSSIEVFVFMISNIIFSDPPYMFSSKLYGCQYTGN